MLLFTLLFSALFSHAASIAPLSNSEVLVVGPLSDSSGENFTVQFNKVLFALPQGQDLTIYLNSEGGSLDSAEDIVKVIKTAQQYGVQVRTIVPSPQKITELFKQAILYRIVEDPESHVIVPAKMPQKAICLSACTLLFAAGNKRSAVSDAVFMFHAPQPAEWLTGVASEQKIKEEMTAYAANWLEIISKASPKIGRFLSAEKIFTSSDKEFAASAEQINKTFPDFIQEIEK